MIFYPKASKTQLHICHESPVYLQIFLCFPICQPRNSLWLLSLGAKACHETGSTVTGLLLDTVTEVTGSSLLYFPHMLPHSPAGPECVWTDPHPCPSDSVRQRERRPHTRTQGLQNPSSEALQKGTQALGGHMASRPTQPLLPLRGGGQAKRTRPGPCDSHSLHKEGAPWPRESLEGGLKMRAQRSFPRLAWEAGSCPHGKSGCMLSPKWSSGAAAAGTHDGPWATGSKILMMQRAD